MLFAHCIYPFFPFAILPLLLLLEECQQTSRLEFLNEALDDGSLDGLGGYTDTWMDEWMSAWYNIHPYIFIESLRNVKAFFFGMGSEKKQSLLMKHFYASNRAREKL